jgi:hypothetical protein
MLFKIVFAFVYLLNSFPWLKVSHVQVVDERMTDNLLAVTVALVFTEVAILILYFAVRRRRLHRLTHLEKRIRDVANFRNSS